MNIVIPSKAIHVCVLYSETGYAAERSIIVNNLVPLITEDIKDKIQVSYVPYTNTTQILNMYLFGIRIYISALNSNQCLVLKNTFFDSYPNAIHLNSFSTSTEFNTTYNLVRNLTPDSYTGRLYAKIMEGTTPVILYDSTSTWSTGLKNDIIDNVVGNYHTIEVNTTDYIAELMVLPIGLGATIVLLEDTNSKTILGNIFSASIPYDYNLIFGDALNQYEFPEFVLELHSHNAILIQAYLTAQQLLYSEEINVLLNEPEHPTSDLLIYFKQLFDMAILHSDTKKDYVNLHLSSGFDSTNGQYSIMPYNNQGKLMEYWFALVDDTNIIIGNIV